MAAFLTLEIHTTYGGAGIGPEKVLLSAPPNGYIFPSCNPEILLYWNLAENLDKVYTYEVEIDDNPDFTSACYMIWKNDSLKNYAEACYECSGLGSGTYYWHVRANTVSPCNSVGEWSDTWSFKIGCPSIIIDSSSLRLITNPSNLRELTFDWAAIQNIRGYNIQIDIVMRLLITYGSMR